MSFQRNPQRNLWRNNLGIPRERQEELKKKIWEEFWKKQGGNVCRVTGWIPEEFSGGATWPLKGTPGLWIEESCDALQKVMCGGFYLFEKKKQNGIPKRVPLGVSGGFLWGIKKNSKNRIWDEISGYIRGQNLWRMPWKNPRGIQSRIPSRRSVRISRNPGWCLFRNNMMNFWTNSLAFEESPEISLENLRRNTERHFFREL